MQSLKNDRLIRALLRQPVDRTPVWIMRQAGRYLPEYRELRKQVSDFMTFCRTPELVCEATLQPINRFSLDAAIIFSDILTVPAAMGMEITFKENEGPTMTNPVRSLHDVKKLLLPDVSRDLSYVMDAMRMVVKLLHDNIPLIGFAGSPWTVATYMVEGGGSKTFRHSKMMLYSNPEIMHALLQKLTSVTIDYLNAQIEAGARVIMIFDTWGGLLSHTQYLHFSLDYLTKIATSLKKEVNGCTIPLVFFTMNAGRWLEEIAASGCDAIGLDATIDIAQVRNRVGHRVALQGNLDPFVLFANSDYIRHAVTDILMRYGAGTGHVFNLGHGIDKETPIDHVTVMIEAIHKFNLAKI